MAREVLQQIDHHTVLVRDSQTGIASVEDGRIGIRHSCHPNISTSGNPRQVYGPHGRIKRANGCAYNTADCIVSDELDELARRNCLCGGQH